MTDVANTPAPGAGSASGATVTGAPIRLDGVEKRFRGQDQPAVGHLDLDIEAGHIVAFVGPSGCGKTTTLKMINRLIEPSDGRIFIDERDVTKENPDKLRQSIGYVIQSGGLFPHWTVEKNIGAIPRVLGWDKKRIAERTEYLLDLVGLDPAQFATRLPKDMSGGQQQRVGVARALAADPPVLLMDEPFGAVDPITRVRLQDSLIAIQHELGKTIVIVTHDFEEATKLGDKVLILSQGAHVEQYAAPRGDSGQPRLTLRRRVHRVGGDACAAHAVARARRRTRLGDHRARRRGFRRGHHARTGRGAELGRRRRQARPPACMAVAG